MPADASTTMALLTQAGMLGIRRKLFTPLPERFESDDFYRCRAPATLAFSWLSGFAVIN